MLTMIRLFLCLAALPALLEAHETERLPRVPVVTASGEAVINVEPDQAEIDVGVVTQARTAPDAAKENAAKLARVIAALKKQLGKNDEVKTAGYSLTPNYRYPREGGKPEITGYTATNVVRVRTANLDHVGKLIDAAMQAGANRVNRLVFTVQDEQGAQLQALRIASTKARAKAEAIAGALGLQIARVISVAEAERGVRPILMARAVDAQETAAAAPTPIEAGTIEVRSTVHLTAEVEPR